VVRFDRFLPGDQALNLSSPKPLTKRLRTKLFGEVFLVAKFGLVGLLATAIHMLIVWLVLREQWAPPWLANTLAFLAAFGISFAGNYRWTFGAPEGRGRAFRRFLLVSLLAFGLNSLVLAMLLRAALLSDLASALWAAVTVPFFSFTLSRFWAFRHAASQVAR
jgi:putative flippase GtrA